jgi:tRNA threonylcarbamoyladenosine biosynthesis protein TsaB
MNENLSIAIDTRCRQVGNPGAAGNADNISIAIETSCRQGSCAIGRGDALLADIAFDASQRHAALLLGHLDAMLKSAGRQAGDLREVYVSCGPGSFTGLRVGVTVGRTLAQATAGLRCVAVPTAAAVAYNTACLDWQKLCVVMDAGEGFIYSTFFSRAGTTIIQDGQSAVAPAAEFTARLAEGVLLIGEGLKYHMPALQAGLGDRLMMAPAGSPLHMPTAGAVWQVGRQLARAGQFTDYNQLLPIYSRAPEALRLWNLRQGTCDK